jgi:hypothetical protein
MKLVIFIIILSSFQAIAFDASSQQRINLDVKITNTVLFITAN